MFTLSVCGWNVFHPRVEQGGGLGFFEGDNLDPPIQFEFLRNTVGVSFYGEFQVSEPCSACNDCYAFPRAGISLPDIDGC